MQYKLTFGDGGDVRHWLECSSPAIGNWTNTNRPFGYINSSGAGTGGASWQVGDQHLILEAHHLSDIIKGLQQNFAETKFILPLSGVVYIAHQYWQSATRQNTLNYTNFHRPGYRKMAEEAQHRHRFVLGTGAIWGRYDWQVNSFGMNSITGKQLSLVIASNKSKIKKAHNIIRDVAEEGVGSIPLVAGLLGL